MLTDLQIRNFAIIDDLHISFGPGLCIMSGETGAGKSIILGALNLVLGGRASADLIRTGEQEALVEALFDISTHPSFQGWLENQGLVQPGDETILIKRTISRENKNKIFINGSLSVLTYLTEISEALLMIAGQHEHQELLRPQNHLTMLDYFGGLLQKRAQYRQRFLASGKLKKELETRKAGIRQRAERQELLTFQLQEIDDARLVAGEDEALKHERKIQQNASELIQSTHQMYESLYGSDNSVLTQVNRIQKELAGLQRIDPVLEERSAIVEQAAIQLEDIAFSLRDYGQNLHFDPQKLEEIEDRLALINRLKKKYAPTIEEILALHAQMAKEIDDLAHGSDRIAELEREYEAVRTEAQSLAQQLSSRRKERAQALANQMQAELASLGMKDARFDTRFGLAHEADESGLDTLEFFFSPNPGETMRPLARIASGGELSRLTLAFKHLFARQEDIATLIFDEVDAGIGGATAEVVGQKLHEISLFHQTICITHLPQIAAFGDTHYAISKRISDGRTKTVVRKLTTRDRVDELARMLGGEEITSQTRSLAREMIRRVSKKKEKTPQ